MIGIHCWRFSMLLTLKDLGFLDVIVTPLVWRHILSGRAWGIPAGGHVLRYWCLAACNSWGQEYPRYTVVAGPLKIVVGDNRVKT